MLVDPRFPVDAPIEGAYNASKHAIEGLADSWRLELIDAGIHVATIPAGTDRHQLLIDLP